MRRHPGRLASLLLIALIANLPNGCQDTSRPQIQTLGKTDRGLEPEEKFEPPTPAQRTEALARLDRAIIAHGGPVRLRKLQTCIQKLKGPFDFPGLGVVQAEQELKMRLPDRVRLKVTTLEADKKTYVVAANAGDGWWSLQGNIQDMTDVQHQDAMRDIHFRRVLTLLPLRDSEFTLWPIDGEQVAGRATLGLRVGSKSQPAVKLFFDAETNLLLQMSIRYHEAGIPLLREVLFSDHKSVADGLVMPTHIIDRRNGKSLFDCSVEYQFPAEIESSEFVRP